MIGEKKKNFRKFSIIMNKLIKNFQKKIYNQKKCFNDHPHHHIFWLSMRIFFFKKNWKFWWWWQWWESVNPIFQFWMTIDEFIIHKIILDSFLIGQWKQFPLIDFPFCHSIQLLQWKRIFFSIDIIIGKNLSPEWQQQKNFHSYSLCI